MDSPFPVPDYPPRDWFTDRPDWLQPGMKLTVDDDGRVAGYFYDAGQCLVHQHGACVQASPTNYAAFHQNDVALADGTILRVGVIGNVHGHADPYSSINAAVAHYADPARQKIACMAYDDEHGGYVLGSLVPGSTFADAALVRRSALSGDWRPFPQPWFQAHGHAAVRAAAAGEWYDCIGPTLVTRPGLPLIKRFGQRAAALGGQGGIDYEGWDPPMGDKTVIDLGGGVTVTRDSAAPAMPPGPVRAASADGALLAAPPPPPGGPANAADNGDQADPPENDTGARLDKIEQDIADIKDVLGQLIDAVSAPQQGSVELPPEE